MRKLAIFALVWVGVWAFWAISGFLAERSLDMIADADGIHDYR